jgi:hypothetical protein
VTAEQGDEDVRISKMLVKFLSAAALLGGLCAPWAMAVGAESPRPSAATSTSPVGRQGRSQSGATAPGKNQREIASSSAIAVVGSPQATQPVAAWDVVPFQVFDKPFHVGVVAFHETGLTTRKVPHAAVSRPPHRNDIRLLPTLRDRGGRLQVIYLFRTQAYGKDARTSVYHSRDFGIDNDAEHYVTTLPVAAPEIFRHEGQWYLAALLPNLKGIQLTRLEWAPVR